MSKLLRFVSLYLIGILLMHNAMAQATQTLHTPTCAYYDDGAVGRVASDGLHIISSHRHFGYSEFIWMDPSTNTGVRFVIYNDFYINDFERLSDTVYFCGHYDEYGVVGYFTESVFTSGTGNVAFAKIPQIYTLKKMEVYTDPNSGNHTIAAVGEDPIDPTNAINTGIFVFEFIGSNIQYNYRIDNRLYYNKVYQDIAVTDNFIVASGQYNLATNQFALTVIDKHNTGSFLPLVPIETVGTQNSWRYSIEHLEKDDVAISTLVAQSGIVNFYSPIHIFDASTATFKNSQNIPLVSKAAPYNEMKYFPDYQTLLLLQTNFYPDESAINSVIYYLDPYNTANYSALIIHHDTSFYYSLDRYSKKQVLATGNIKNIYSHSFMIHDITAQPLFNCLENDNINIDPILPPNDSNGYYPLPYNSQCIIDYLNVKCNVISSQHICK